MVDDSVRNFTSCPRLTTGLVLSTELERFRFPAPACPKNFSLLSFLMILMPAIPSIIPTLVFEGFDSGSFVAFLMACCSFFSRSESSSDSRSWTVKLILPSDRDPRLFSGSDGSASSSSSSSSCTIEHFLFLPF